MPTYDYVCDACGDEFELFQQMSAPVKRKCQKCGKLKLRRLVGTGAGVLFKGSGFYETDYRSSGYKEAAKKEQDAGKPPTEGKKDGTSDGAKKDAATKSEAAAPKKESGAGKKKTSEG